MAVQTTASGMSYVGNPDFRGYVAANAPQYLSLVGNDGGVNQNALANYGTINQQGAGPEEQQRQSQATSAIQNLYSQFKGYNQGQVLGASTGSGGINSPGYLQGIQNEYGASIANAQRQIPFYQNYMNTLTGAASNQAEQQRQDENNTFAANNNAYETQKQGVSNQQKLSLAELADQIHGQNVGLTNQLGTIGAGSSSAVGAGQNALARVQNTNRADIQQQSGTNLANISAAQQGLFQQHQSNLDQIANFKTNTLNQIIGYYTPLIQNAQTALHQAQGEEQRLAAMYNLKSLSNEATGALSDLDNSVNALTQRSLQSLSTPESLSPLTVKAAPTAVQSPSTSPFNVGNTGAGNTTASPTGGSLSALMDQLKQQQ